MPAAMLLKPLSIFNRLLASLVGSVTLLFMLAFYLQFTLSTVARFQPDFEARTQMLGRVTAIEPLVTTMQASLEGYLQTGQAAYLRPYYQAEERLREMCGDPSLKPPLIDDAKVPGGDAASVRFSLELWRREFADPAVARGSAATAEEKEALITRGRELFANQQRATGEFARQLVIAKRAGEEEERLEIKGVTALMWLAVGIVTLATLGLLLLLARSIIQPLRRLSRAARKLEQGELTAPVEIQSGDEIQQLADSFNSMAESLVKNRQELEANNRRLTDQQESLSLLNTDLERRVALQTEELRATLTSAEDERAKLSTLVQRLPDGLVLIDDHGRLLNANAAALQILGHAHLNSVQEWLDSRPGAFAFRQLDEKAVAEAQFPFHRTRRGEAFSNYVLHMRRPDNETRLVSFSGGPVQGGGSEPVRLGACIFRDVTLELDLRRELVEKNQQLGEASRLKDEFLATLSHELRTPLTPIIANAQLLLDDGSQAPEDLARTMRVIERNGRVLARMIDEMLDLSAIMNRKMRLHKERIELGEAVRAVVEGLRPIAEKKRQELHFEPPAEPLPVPVDPARLAQVVTNLVTNAVKYTGERGEIRVKVEQVGQQAWISVRDNGSGLARHEMDEIFAMFHQARSATASRAGGLGIGLSVAKSLAEQHGGGILVESPGPGLGSTFTVWLPLTEPESESELVATEPPETMRGPSPPRAEDAKPVVVALGGLRDRRLLIVEDADDTRDILKRLLTRRGAQVRVAASGEAALKLAADLTPEIVISDVGLPGMSGLDFARKLRAGPGGREAVMIALSGLGREQDTEAAIAAGFDLHLLKPVDIAVLERELARLWAERAEEGAR